MNFEEARAEYTRLRQAYDNRQLSPEEYARRVQGLQVRDDGGTYWAIDGGTGNWLRYDGSNWVPGQPPVAQRAASQPTVIAPPQAQPAGSAAPAQAPAAPARRSARTPILIGCGVLLLLALLGCGIGAFLVSRSGGFSLGTTAGITDMVIATDIGADNKPLVSAQQVNLGTPVYVTFTAKQMKGKKITTRITRDGAPVEFKDNSNILTPEQNTVYYSLQFKPQQKGTYKAEAVVDDEATARQTATFTVR